MLGCRFNDLRYISRQKVPVTLPTHTSKGAHYAFNLWLSHSPQLNMEDSKESLSTKVTSGMILVKSGFNKI
jgi:hypothetical protein